MVRTRPANDPPVPVTPPAPVEPPVPVFAPIPPTPPDPPLADDPPDPVVPPVPVPTPPEPSVPPVEVAPPLPVDSWPPVPVIPPLPEPPPVAPSVPPFPVVPPLAVDPPVPPVAPLLPPDAVEPPPPEQAPMASESPQIRPLRLAVRFISATVHPSRGPALTRLARFRAISRGQRSADGSRSAAHITPAAETACRRALTELARSEYRRMSFDSPGGPRPGREAICPRCPCRRIHRGPRGRRSR